LDNENKGKAHTEMHLRHLLEEKQQQDRRIAQPEKELASDSVLKPPPENRGYNNTADFDKSEKGDEHQSQSSVSEGGSLRYPRRISLASADDDYGEQQTEILAAPNLVSNQSTVTATTPPLGSTVASEVPRGIRAPQSTPIPLGLQRRSDFQLSSTSDSSAQNSENLELSTNEPYASQDITPGKRPSYPSQLSTVRHYETSTKFRTKKEKSKVMNEETSTKSANSAWKRFFTGDKYKRADAPLYTFAPGPVNTYARAPKPGHLRKTRAPERITRRPSFDEFGIYYEG
jgi:hypothetical protein